MTPAALGRHHPNPQNEATLHITVTRQHNGTLLSTIHNGQYHKKLYIGYTLKEAKRDFRKFVRSS